MSECRNNQRGFTLIETLVALAIAALVMATAIGTLSSAVERTRNAELMIGAKQLARAKIEAARLEDFLENDEGTKGPYRWRVELSPFLTDLGGQEQAGARPSGLSEISVTVAWNDAGRARELTLQSLRAEPQG